MWLALTVIGSLCRDDCRHGGQERLPAAGLIPLNFAAGTPLTPQVRSWVIACDCKYGIRHRLIRGATSPQTAERSREPVSDYMHVKRFPVVDDKPLCNILAWRYSRGRPINQGRVWACLNGQALFASSERTFRALFASSERALQQWQTAPATRRR